MFADASNAAADWVIRSDPALPLGISVLFGLLGAALTTWLYLREDVEASPQRRCCLAGIRIGVIGLVVFFAQGWSIHPFVTEQPELIIVMDNSRSMSLADHDSKPESDGAPVRTRLELARDILLQDNSQRLRSLAAQYRLCFYTLDDRLDGVRSDDPRKQLEALVADAESSPIATRVQQIIELQRGRSTAAIVLFTDGNSTDQLSLQRVAKRAKQAGIALFPVGIGRESLPLDLDISDLSVDRAAFVGDLLTFDVTVRFKGQHRARARLRLERDDLTVPIEVREVEVRNEMTRVRLSHRATDVGRHSYSVTADPLEDEPNLENNHASVEVEIMDETIRVLLVGAVPSYEFRHLKLALSRATIAIAASSSAPFQVSTLLQDADAEFHQIDRTAIAAFPADREELLAYDVIIFCDANPHRLRPGALDDLVQVVGQQGRGFVAIAGPHFMPSEYGHSAIKALLPVELESSEVPATRGTFDESFHVRPTALAASMGFMQLATSLDMNADRWRQLPPLFWSYDVRRMKPAARVLATRASQTTSTPSAPPLILLHYFGAGRTLFHATDETHRWRTQANGECYNRYWSQAIRFLGHGKLTSEDDVVLAADQRTQDVWNTVRLRADFPNAGLAPESEDGVRAVIERELGPRDRIVLRRSAGVRRRFEAVVENLKPGKYHAWIEVPEFADDRPSCDFDVVSDSLEMRRLTIDREELQKAATESGGRFLTLTQSHELVDSLPRGQIERVESLTPQPIWNWWGWALLCVAFLSLEWTLRKRTGMI